MNVKTLIEKYNSSFQIYFQNYFIEKKASFDIFLKYDIEIDTELLICVNVTNVLSKEDNIKLMNKISMQKFQYILLNSNFSCLDYTETNLKMYPFNFYKYQILDNDLVLISHEDFLENMQNLGKLFIKTYNGSYMKNFVNYSFHEEFLNYIGNCDDIYTTFGSLKMYFLKTYNTLPKVILIFWNFSEKMYARIRKQLPECKIILWVDDLHWFDSETYEKNKFSYQHADRIITHYNLFNLFYNIDRELILSPHSCCSHFYREEVNEKAIRKIYMYGVATLPHYHLRNWFMDMMQKYYSDIFHYNYPSNDEKYNYERSIQTGKELYEYQICYTSGFFPKFEISEPKDPIYYLPVEFFEIFGNGALLLCNDYGVRKELNKLGFHNMIHYINITDQNFHEKISWILDSKNEKIITKIRKKGHELVKKYYQTLKKCENINSIISS